MAIVSKDVNTLPLLLRWLTGIAAVGSAFLAMDSLRLFSERPLLDFAIILQNLLLRPYGAAVTTLFFA